MDLIPLVVFFFPSKHLKIKKKQKTTSVKNEKLVITRKQSKALLLEKLVVASAGP